MLTQDRHRTLAIAIGVAAVAVRLIAINQPFVDNWSWRQSDVASIARNYFEGGFHFAYPQIDWAGNEPGYVGTEFPILPFLAAIIYRFAGAHEWIGRIQAVFLFAVSLPFFFLLVRGIFGASAATWATFFFAFAPLNLFAGRSFMPDVPSLSLGLIGLYFFYRWIEDAPVWRSSLIAAAVCVSLSILLKATSAIIGAPLLCLAWTKFGSKLFRQPTLWLFAGITLLPSAIWYWHSYQIAQQFYPHHFFGAGGFRIETLSRYGKIATETLTTSLTPILSIFGAIGLILGWPNRRARLFHWWFIAMALFVIVVGWGNRHAWYQLPFVPIMAALSGAACTFVASKTSAGSLKITLSFLLIVVFAFFAFANVRPFYKESAAELREAGLRLKQSVPANALVIAGDNGDPTIFYYAGRKGWHFPEKEGIFQGDPNDGAQLIVDLGQLQQRGATHLVLTTNSLWWLDVYPDFVKYLEEHAKLVETSWQFRIYELHSQ